MADPGAVPGVTPNGSTRPEQPAANRRASEATHHAAPTFHELRQDLARLAAQNDRLTASLRSARAQIVQLKSDIERISGVPNSYATFLSLADGTTIDVLHNGRKMRVATSPDLRLSELQQGQEVMLNENLAAVAARPCGRTGQIVPVVDALPDGRVVVQSHADEQRVLDRAAQLHDAALHPGDQVLVDLKSGLLLERVERSEIADLVLEQVPSTSFADIGGLGDQIEAIRDAVELPFLHQDLFREHGLRPPKGVLLYGPPGCGKTMIAQAVAHELAVRVAESEGKDAAVALAASYFLNVKGPELLNKYVGETERSIRLVFERAREKASAGYPVVVFFDEMESLFRTRGTGVSSDVENTIVPQLLAEIDGVERLDNVIVIGASNREDMIDPAILRPGRLDVKIRIRRPDAQAAREILDLHLGQSVPVIGDRAVLLNDTVDAIYAQGEKTAYVEIIYTGGEREVLHYRDFVSGAMLRNIIDRAKKAAVKSYLSDGHRGITRHHLLAAVDAEFDENEDLPSSAHPEDWARISGRRGRRVDQVRPLRQERNHSLRREQV
ncbi:proteasome ATPase [Devriesea agamarum]|uniref:proteasome ATPase n=1 Tax=Devriesea agamarum TaxID=472569 RepID=UPI000A0211B3